MNPSETDVAAQTIPPVKHLVIPFSKLTADQCAVVAARGRTAIAALGGGKVGRVLRSRFIAAIQRLESIANRGSYGSTPADLQLDVQAIAVATDFFQIAGTLPSTLSKNMADDLSQALQGRLGPNGTSRVAEQFLTQLWFGLVLVRGGISPLVPKRESAVTPDYIMEVDQIPLAVEVKRPESLQSAPDTMDHAADQLRKSGKPGLIAMDLTDALMLTPNMPVLWMDQPGLLHAVISGQFGMHSDRLENRARKYRRSDKYSHVISLSLFMRLHFWERPDLSQPKASYLFSTVTLENAYNGILLDTARRVNRIVMRGASEVAGGAIHQL
jgi:hypothetical protein